MSRTLLHQAADEVATGGREITDTEASDRLRTLADQLRSQAERNATPALGALDRIQYALHEIAAETDDETVSDRLETARGRIFSFLETLDDRGMKQHGWSENAKPNGPT